MTENIIGLRSGHLGKVKYKQWTKLMNLDMSSKSSFGQVETPFMKFDIDNMIALDTYDMPFDVC